MQTECPITTHVTRKHVQYMAQSFLQQMGLVVQCCSNRKNSKEIQGSYCSISFQQTSYGFGSCVLIVSVGLHVLGSLNSAGIPELIFFGSYKESTILRHTYWKNQRITLTNDAPIWSGRTWTWFIHLSSIPIIVLKNCHKPHKHQTYKNWHNVWSWKTFTNKQTCNGQTNLVHGLWFYLLATTQHGQIR